VDPCGERGEYHSFTFDGPLFRRPVPYRLGDVHHHAPFAFQELYPESQMALSAAVPT
jgi:diphthamide synthase (EF-2-diphthine--ammonia ligase)